MLELPVGVFGSEGNATSQARRLYLEWPWGLKIRSVHSFFEAINARIALGIDASEIVAPQSVAKCGFDRMPLEEIGGVCFQGFGVGGAQQIDTGITQHARDVTGDDAALLASEAGVIALTF